MSRTVERAKRKRSDLFDREDEETILGALATNIDHMEDVEHVLRAEDFGVPQHQAVYGLICDLAKEGVVDVGTLIAAADDRGIERYGGASFLFNLPKKCVAPEGVPLAARRVRNLAIRREVHAIAHTIREAAHTEMEVEDVLAAVDVAVGGLRRVGTSGSTGFRPSSTLAGEALDALQERMRHGGNVPGMATGFSKLDDVLGGFHRGHLVLLAARPAMGKTAMSIALALNVARHTPVGIIELEMRDEALMRRMLANVSGVEAEKIKTGQLGISDMQRMGEAAEYIAALPLYVDDTPAVTVSGIRTRVRRLKQAHPDLGLVVVDYLQIVKTEGRHGANRTELVGEMSMGLKHLAREMDVCILALSQLNRDLERREDKRPMLSDLRDSGSLEQDADTVLFLYRDEVYDEHSELAGTAEVLISKQRDGRTGKVWFAWDGQRQRFSILDRGEPYASKPAKMASVKRFPKGRDHHGEDDQ